MTVQIMFSIFWAAISYNYLNLLIKHYQWSKHTFPRLPKRPTAAKILGVPLNIRESVQDINRFMRRLNIHNKQSNMAQFRGYVAAFCASLAAFIISLISLIGSLH